MSVNSLGNVLRELQCLLSTATSERDIACNERNDLMGSNANLLTKAKMLSSERDAALREKESTRTKLDKIAADFEADYETVRSKVDTLVVEKKALEDKITFLEASKASVEGNADRILQRDNALAGQYDRMKVEFKKQTMKTSELQDEVNNLIKRLMRLKGENGQLSRDNAALKDMIKPIQTSAIRAEDYRESNGKKKTTNGKKKAMYRF